MNKVIFLLCLTTCGYSAGAQVNVNLSKGNEYYQASQFDMAAAQYRKALEAEPNNTTAQYNLANALQKQKKYDDAIQLLNQLAYATTDRHLKFSAYYNQGVAYSHLKNLEQSIESYKSALRLEPEDQEARENLQKALLELKKKQQQEQKDQKKPEPKMSQKEAEQKLKMLQQKEKELQQQKNKNKQNGSGQAQDW